ncbi:4'-demethylrebeccamycin synthase [Actinomadura rubteroloni]|uniref:4'-demethylrebeccamycin synthase n=1 Tax=Actinomadura rubteroloni TaxID=1926885 RepID=A0A2P4UCN0_9ACTN|nr:nucleotide disphospho-sugar-binding domain-containing protein [Actinomadura rubteroloni]POM22809.1 4'-demethylrebeccamycin synthase [Actinomadura rubteroloni]
MRARRVQVPSLDTLLGTAPVPPEDDGPERRRFLFAVPAVAGAVAPARAVAEELAARGHRVAWAGHRERLEPLLRGGSRVFHAEDPAWTAALDTARREGRDLRGPAALRFRWERLLIPLGHAMLPGVENAVDRFRPDVVVADQDVLAAPVVARRRGLPWATSASTSAEFTRPLAALPLVEEWIRDLIGGFQLDNGIEDLVDLRFSDHLALVYSTAALFGDVSYFPDHVAFVGPALGAPPRGDFPLDRLDGRPAVLVTLGGADGPGAARFLRAAADALAGMDVQAVVVATDALLPDPPPNALVFPHVPQRALLEHMAAVVSHGGHTTVTEALAQGLPQVVAPIRDDQPVVARQVEACGAGRSVRFGRCTAADLRAALADVLTDASYRTAAGRVRASFHGAGGAAAAADRLEKLT